MACNNAVLKTDSTVSIGHKDVTSTKILIKCEPI